MRIDDDVRVPPHSIEAEQSVIGGLMLSPKSLFKVYDKLQPEDFYHRTHQLIYRSIVALDDKKKPFDAVTLGEWFESQGLSDQVDGGAYLIELAKNTPSAANIEAYAEIVAEKSMMRKLIEVGTGITSRGFNPDGLEGQELLAQAVKDVFALLNQDRSTDTIKTGRESLHATLVEMKRRMDAGGRLLGVETSLDDLDDMLLGLQDSDLIVLAARPGMGKTALALQMFRRAARIGKRPFFVSMEMSGEQLDMRHIASVGSVNHDHVKQPHLATPVELERIRRAYTVMQEWDSWTDVYGSMTAQRLAGRIRRMHAEHGIGIVFIDYLQMIDLGPEGTRNTARAIQEVTRILKSLAKQLNIPIVLLSQLNRNLESRPDKRPNMSDLRESGAIEQDADVILFIYREGYYEKGWADDDPRQLMTEIIVSKARNGTTGTVNAAWRGKFQTFDRMGREDIPDHFKIEEDKRREREKAGRSGAGFRPHRHAGAAIEGSARRSGAD